MKYVLYNAMYSAESQYFWDITPFCAVDFHLFLPCDVPEYKNAHLGEEHRGVRFCTPIFVY
jgi:hypothetical protein